MFIGSFFKGSAIGFSIAAPVGPIGVLCIRRTLMFGFLSGLCSGLGAATADTFYGFIAAFGLTFISELLVAQQMWFRLIGGLFLVYLGIRTFQAVVVSAAAIKQQEQSLIADYFSTLFLTITNPMTIIAFVGIFAAAGLGTFHGYADAFLMAGGVFVGAMTWWSILSFGVSLLRAKVDRTVLSLVNKISGVIIATFGILAVASIIRM